MVYRLKYLDFHTSRSLSSYGSEWTRIGFSPFDTTCWMVRMRMRNFMCFRAGHLNDDEYGEKAMKGMREVVKVLHYIPSSN